MALTKAQNHPFGQPNWITKLVYQFRTEHKDIEKKVNGPRLNQFFLPSGSIFLKRKKAENQHIGNPIVGKVGRNLPILSDEGTGRTIDPVMRKSHAEPKPLKLEQKDKASDKRQHPFYTFK